MNAEARIGTVHLAARCRHCGEVITATPWRGSRPDHSPWYHESTDSRECAS